MRNLRSHLSISDENHNILILGKKDNKDNIENSINDISVDQKSLTIVDIDTQALPLSENFDLVILVFDHNPTALEVNLKCKPFKDRGIPVVFGHDQRGLFYNKSDWRSADLTMAGMFYLASQYLKHIDEKGSYVEFGVFDGRSFTCAYHNLNDICTSFIGFDSFAGIQGSIQSENFLYNDGDYYANIETFWHNMKVAGVDQNRVKAIKGDFRQTLTTSNPSVYGIDSISIAHIDADITEAALLALEFISPALIDGALLMFDEYHAFSASNKMGERLAHKLWLEKHPEFETEIYRNYNPVSRSFIVHRA